MATCHTCVHLLSEGHTADWVLLDALQPATDAAAQSPTDAAAIAPARATPITATAAAAQVAYSDRLGDAVTSCWQSQPSALLM